MPHSHAADDYRLYREALRRRVCVICLDADDEGRCELQRSCAVEARLSALVSVVSRLHGSHETWAEQVDRGVCVGCPDRAAGGGCRLRENGGCAVAAYLPLIVEAIRSPR